MADANPSSTITQELVLQSVGQPSMESRQPGKNYPRIGNILWCQCGNCAPMKTFRESVCCQEDKALEQHLTRLTCIIENAKVKEIQSKEEFCRQMLMYNDQDMKEYDKEKIKQRNRELRRRLYRAFSHFAYGPKGQYNRVVNPSCAVKYIRNLCPDPDGEYEGFRDANE